MTTVKIAFPKELGAVFSYVTDDDGQSLADRQLTTPDEPVRTLELKRPGRYTLYWSTVGGQQRSLQFEAGEQSIELDVPIADRGQFVDGFSGIDVPLRSTELALSSSAPIVILNGPPVTDAATYVISNYNINSRNTLAEFKVLGRPTRLPRAASRDAPPKGRRLQSPSIVTPSRFKVGIASDTTPDEVGGWKPYFSPFRVEVFSSTDRLTFKTDYDGEEQLEAGRARVRYSIAVQRSYLRRFLLPIYLGGVEVTLKAAGPRDDDISLSIYPSRTEARLIIQALTASSSKEAQALVDTSQADLQTKAGAAIDGKLGDPWLAVASGFVARRYGWDDMDFAWTEPLAEYYPWISDTLILAAWWNSTKRGGSDYRACLHYLSSALDRGIPYFADANDTIGDLLVWFASDCPDEPLKMRGRRELNRWRKNTRSYSRAGATLTKISKFGPGVSVSRKSEFIAFEGKVSDLSPSISEVSVQPRITSSRPGPDFSAS
jgi:hypothetical protein